MRELTEREREIQLKLATKINAFKDLHDMSMAKIAKGMGYTAPSLSNFMSGRTPIGYEALFNMCQYLGISPLDVDPTLARRLGHPELQRL